MQAMKDWHKSHSHLFVKSPRNHAGRDSYGPDQLKLVVACRYIETLLSNPKLARYLTQHHRDILKEFQQIVDVTIRQPASAPSEELEDA